MRGTRRFVVASAIALVVMTAFLPGLGLGSPVASVRGARAGTPAALAAAIRARIGAGTIRLSSRSYDPATADPQMGTSVALSADGTTALVGAPGANNGKGAVFVFYVTSAGSWTSSATPSATLIPGGGGRGLGFGFSVALSADGTTAFVGAPYYGRTAGLLPPGAIFVFHVANENAWGASSAPALLTITGEVFVGTALSVSADGTTLLTGDLFLNGLFGGGAEIFHASAEDAWHDASSPTATLSNATQAGNDGGVGSAVAISADGTTALLCDTGATNGAGGADVFHVASEGAWATTTAPTATLSDASREFSNDALGWGLALSGDGTTAFLGAPGNDAGAPTPGTKKTAGAVDVFHVSGEGAWASSSAPTARLTASGGLGNDGLGALVSASADGTTAVATAPGAHKGKGAAYVFRVSGESAWTTSAAPTATLTNSAGTTTDFFGLLGLGTSADGATVLVGAPGTNWNTGAADVFHVSAASSWRTSSTTTAKLTNSALPRPTCVVPRLVGLHLSDAKDELVISHSKCRLGRVKKVHAKKKWRHRIVSQKPHPGKHLPAGAKISVKIGK